MLSWYPATLMQASQRILGRRTIALELHNDSCSGRRTFDRGLLAPRGNQIGLRSARGGERYLARQFQNNAGGRDQYRNRRRRHGARAGLSYIVDAARQELARSTLVESRSAGDNRYSADGSGAAKSRRSYVIVIAVYLQAAVLPSTPSPDACRTTSQDTKP